MPTETDLAAATPSALRSLTWLRLAELEHSEIRAAARALRPAVLPPVNTSLVSPEGFDAFVGDARIEPRPIAVARTRRDLTFDLLHDDVLVARLGPAGFLAREHLRALRPFAGVHVPPGVGSGPVAVADLIRQLLVAGVPVRAPELPLSVDRLLGPVLGEIVDALTPGTMSDPDARERWSVRARRAALLLATAAAGVPSSRPGITAVVQAGDEQGLARLVEQVRSQTWRPLHVTIAAGDDDTVPDAVTATLDDDGLPVDVVRAADRVEACARALRSAATELATIMTPQLAYGPEHLTDLVLGRGYARRPVAGVVVRRTFLQPLGVTVYGGAPGERPAHSLTTATVLADASTLLDLGAHQRNGTEPLDVGARGYAIHDLSVFGVVSGDPVRVDDALRKGERQYAGHPSGDTPAPVDPAYASYFTRIESRSA